MNVHEFQGGLTKAIDYIHTQWGTAQNYPYYVDAISHSDATATSIPQFYVLLCDQTIIGCYGLIINDFISRHDIYPWLCSLYIEPDYRGNRLSDMIFIHAREIVGSLGYEKLYLTTDHDGFYEKFGWQRMEDGYGINGDSCRIYYLSIRQFIESNLSDHCSPL